MSRCAKCKGNALSRSKEQFTYRFGDLKVTVLDVPATRCDACGELYFGGPDLERAEVQVAQTLAATSVEDPRALQFMRKAIGMKATEFARLVDVKPETVSRWESGERDMPRATRVVLQQLVLEHGRKQQPVTEALRRERPKRGPVELRFA